jgi:murein DD-endopeptidase MepM/ murein hydrolase activator NlpD
MSRSGRIASVAVFVVLASHAGLMAAEDVTLAVSHRARAIQPGEAVILEVRPSAPPVAVHGTVFGHGVRFFEATPPDGVWRALVGIDLETEPGDYELAVRASTLGGRTVHATYTLGVEAKEFPTRHLKVNPSFVNPPSEVIDRIQREARDVAAIFQKASVDRQWRGGFVAPVSGESTSSFGRRSVYNGEPRSPHSGTDFRAGEGTPVGAPNAGTVVLTGDLYFSGNVVIIDHGWGLYSYFAHLSAIDVAEGDTVTRGQVVGRVGATGRVTGPHLHWTVRLNDARVDPRSLMTLLPHAEP